PLAEMQTQPCALVPMLGWNLDPSKCLKQIGLVCSPDANAGVHDFDFGPYVSPYLLLAKFDNYAPLLRKLDGVVGEIKEDLAEGATVGLDHEVNGGHWYGKG